MGEGEASTNRPAALERGLIWTLIALSSSGLVMFGWALFGGRIPRAGLNWTVFGALLAVAALASWRLMVLEARRRRAERDLKAQLFTTDLLAGSFLVAGYFAGFLALYEPNFVPYGVLGGAAWAGALVISLLHASRRGHFRFRPRWAFALGYALSYLGLGCASLLAFYCLVTPLFTSWAVFLQRLTDYETAPLRIAGFYGALGLLAGQGLLWWVRRGGRGAENAECGIRNAECEGQDARDEA
ncbi:MAG: hypothetical protein M5U26_27400 [Planctomycetota bacterium]|nr:hypothetical protein [Planctomycetota bacterium]